MILVIAISGTGSNVFAACSRTVDREEMPWQRETTVMEADNVHVADDTQAAGEESSSALAEQTEQADAPERLSVSEICQLPAHTAVDTEDLTEEEIDGLFYATDITEDIYIRINHCSYTEGGDISTEELNYIRVLHRGIDGNTYIGELIVNSGISEDILGIMRELYRADYPIERMVLVDEYGADDDRSMEANNTSAFNYRTVAGTDTLSNHSYGCAIDINPLYNPYVREKSNGTQVISPSSGAVYTDRSEDFPYRIDHDDLCYQLFTEHGFTWGGDWSNPKDYQHFEKT